MKQASLGIEACFIFLGILWAKIDILKNRRKYQLKYTFLIANNWHFPMLLSIISLRLLVVQSWFCCSNCFIKPGTIREVRRICKPERITCHICCYLHHRTSDSNLNLFYFIEHEQSQLLVKAIQHHNLPESDICQPIFQAERHFCQHKLSPNSVPAQFTPAFNQRLFDVKGETIGIAVHGNVNNHTPFLQRCPLAIDLRSFEMELVP